MFNLKDYVSKKFYKDLIKCDFLKDAIEMVKEDSVTGSDIVDFMFLSEKGYIVGSLSQICNSTNEVYHYNIIRDTHLTTALVNIIGNKNIRIADVDAILERIKDPFNNVEIYYCFGIDNKIPGLYKLQVLLTNRE